MGGPDLLPNPLTTRPVCDYEGSQYQQQFWDRGGRDYEDAAERTALRQLLPRRGNLALEVGAGAGRLTNELDRFGRVVLLDYSRTQLQQAQERLGRSQRYIYVAADVYRLPFVAGLFDTVTMVRVIHHIADPPAALAALRAVLQPDGAFVLEFANKRNLKAIARYLLRRQAWNPFDPDPIEFAKLNFDFHPRTMRQWLRGSGFMIRKLRAVSYLRIGRLKRLLPMRLLVGVDALLQPTGAQLQLSPSVFVRSDADGSGQAAEPGAFFRCPTCGGLDLVAGDDYLVCRLPEGCGSHWAIRDGIYDFKNPAG